MKRFLKRLVPSSLWRGFRELCIIRRHTKVAKICESLVLQYFPECHAPVDLVAKKPDLIGKKILWQYWAQGYSDVPEVVRRCLDSVEKHCPEFEIVRLSDDNIQDYLEIPSFIQQKRPVMGYTAFSDVLRLMLLNVYGGVWADSTIFLTGKIPEAYFVGDYFAFQRDDNEKNKKYWSNAYAYYYGWKKGFRVRMLSSFMISIPGSEIISSMCDMLLGWWKENDSLPDYFFFQILFDVLITGPLKSCNCRIYSDCIPHYMQQCINDPEFNLMEEDAIPEFTTVHKLTYKKEH